MSRIKLFNTHVEKIMQVINMKVQQLILFMFLVSNLMVLNSCFARPSPNLVTMKIVLLFTSCNLQDVNGIINSCPKQGLYS